MDTVVCMHVCVYKVRLEITGLCHIISQNQKLTVLFCTETKTQPTASDVFFTSTDIVSYSSGIL